MNTNLERVWVPLTILTPDHGFGLNAECSEWIFEPKLSRECVAWFVDHGIPVPKVDYNYWDEVPNSQWPHNHPDDAYVLYSIEIEDRTAVEFTLRWL